MIVQERSLNASQAEVHNVAGLTTPNPDIYHLFQGAFAEAGCD